MATIHLAPAKRTWVWAVPVVVAGLALATWAFWPASGPEGSSATPGGGMPTLGGTTTGQAGATAPVGTGIPAQQDQGPGTANPMAADRSLGTLFDLDNHGHLAITSKTKEALDTVLGPYPNGPSTQDWASIEGKLSKDLPKAALQEAMQLLRSMQALNGAVVQLKAANPNAETEGKTVDLYNQLKGIRRQHFDSQTADALFGEEESWGGFMLGMQAIEANTKLSPEAKKQQVAALMSTLPDAMRSKAAEMFGQQ